jgi:hypothetical protein
MSVLERTPVLYVTLDGQRAPADLTRRVLELTLDEGEKKGKALAAHLTLKLDDGDHTLRNLLPHGTVIGVRWGYPGTLSSPRAVVVHACVPSYDNETVTVEAFGKELELSRGAIRHVFEGRTFREAADEIARNAGLSVRFEAEDTIRFDGQVIDNESAWSWITRRSAELGLSVEMEGDVVVVREPPIGAPPALVLLHGWRNGNVLSFEVEEHTKKGQTEDEGVVALFHDPASGQVFSHAAGAPNVTRQTLAARRLAAERRRAEAAENHAVARFVEDHPDLATATPEAQRAAWATERDRRRSGGATATQDEEAFLVVVTETGEVRDDPNTPPRLSPSNGGPATGQQVQVPGVSTGAARAHAERLAQGRYRAQERRKVTAKAKTIGLPTARRGMIVKVLGVDTRDGGLWYVTGCRHTIDGNGYETEFELSRDGVNAGRQNPRHAGPAVPTPTTGQPANTSESPQTTAAPVVVDLEA